MTGHQRVAASPGAALVMQSIADTINRSPSVLAAAVLLVDEDGTPTVHQVERTDPLHPNSMHLTAALATLVAHRTAHARAAAVQACQMANDLLAALQAIVEEVDGPGKPYSCDSYLPPHLIEMARKAIARQTAVQACQMANDLVREWKR